VHHENDKPWITDTYKQLIKDRQLALKSGNMDRYHTLRNKINHMTKNLKRNYYKTKVVDLKESRPAMWWKHAKSLAGKNSTQHNPLQGLANEICDGDMPTLTEKINDFFQSVSGNLPPLDRNHPYFYFETSVAPNKYIISVETVEKQLARLNTRKAAGPDGLPSWILHDFSHLLAKPVCAIFNSSIREGYVPEIWRSATICALPKKTPPKSVESDLRPISLTPILSKELETHIVKWLWDAIEGTIDPTQYGSIKGCSTTHALIYLTHQWYSATDTLGQDVRALFLDYSKAFDLIDHNILMTKLGSLGVPPLILKWICSFLCERKQQVRTSNYTSKWKCINGGVPQGTKLGPVLFILMIHDLRPALDTIKYVDDTTIFTATTDPSTTVLQEAATYAYQWSAQNNMKVNASKTKVMNISFSKKRQFPPIIMEGVELETVSNFKVLGVILADDLTWNAHVDAITKQASKRVFLLSQFLNMLAQSGTPTCQNILVTKLNSFKKEHSKSSTTMKTMKKLLVFPTFRA
jgi:hypothetical protein